MNPVLSSLPITAAPPAWPAADWKALRAAGLAYVEQYAHAHWTDYNRHDPGVTILELLCYAITDLSQRVALPVQDLLASSLGSAGALATAFPGADLVLPSAPVTELDYRKLLLDVDGVRNAWLRARAQAVYVTLPDPTLYADPAAHANPRAHAQLSYQPGAAGQLSFPLRGLYDIVVDLDPDYLRIEAEKLAKPTTGHKNPPDPTPPPADPPPVNPPVPDPPRENPGGQPTPPTTADREEQVAIYLKKLDELHGYQLANDERLQRYFLTTSADRAAEAARALEEDFRLSPALLADLKLPTAAGNKAVLKFLAAADEGTRETQRLRVAAFYRAALDKAEPTPPADDSGLAFYLEELDALKATELLRDERLRRFFQTNDAAEAAKLALELAKEDLVSAELLHDLKLPEVDDNDLLLKYLEEDNAEALAALRARVAERYLATADQRAGAAALALFFRQLDELQGRRLVDDERLRRFFQTTDGTEADELALALESDKLVNARTLIALKLPTWEGNEVLLLYLEADPKDTEELTRLHQLLAVYYADAYPTQAEPVAGGNKQAARPMLAAKVPEAGSTPVTTAGASVTDYQALVQDRVLAAVRTKYLDQRNLGEDCVAVRVVPRQDIMLCADVDLAPGADVAAVHARLLLAVEQYLAPPVRRYSLAEMRALTDADGQPLAIEDIFEGPLLAGGFIRDEDLTASPLGRTVYASDLLALALAVPGVAAVRHLRLSVVAPAGGTVPAASLNQAWYLPISPGYQPHLNAEKTRLNFYQGLLPVGNATNTAHALDQYATLREQAHAAQARTTGQLPAPTGTVHDLTSYRPLALDLPATYGVGPAGLPASAPRARRNQARQLRAYLTFFDQLLTNYLAQLTHVGDLLGTDATATTTYFGQRLDARALPELQELFAGGIDGPTDLALASPADPTAGAARKGRFLDHLLARFAENFNEYGLLLYSAQGTRSSSQVLEAQAALAADLGRFHPAQGFRYHRPSWLRQTVDCPYPNEKADADTEDAKRAAALAAGKAYSTDTLKKLAQENDAAAADNVAGIVRRFGRLTAMADFRARWAASPASGLQLVYVAPDKNEVLPAGRHYYQYVLHEPGQPLEPKYELARSERTLYPLAGEVLRLDLANSREQALAAATAAGVAARQRAYSRANWTSEFGRGGYVDQLRGTPAKKGGLGPVLASGPARPAAGQEQADKRLDALVAGLQAGTATETIFVVEHLLLRPFAPDEAASADEQKWVAEAAATAGQWLPACVDPNRSYCEPLDPYSYRVSIVLPGYSPRFADVDYRRYAERALRAELPAHVLARICWVGPEDLLRFEAAYHEWLRRQREWGAPAPGTRTREQYLNLAQARGQLRLALDELSSIYPAGWLYSCDSPTGEGAANPLLLDRTTLG